MSEVSENGFSHEEESHYEDSDQEEGDLVEENSSVEEEMIFRRRENPRKFPFHEVESSDTEGETHEELELNSSSQFVGKDFYIGHFVVQGQHQEENPNNNTDSEGAPHNETNKYLVGTSSDSTEEELSPKPSRSALHSPLTVQPQPPQRVPGATLAKDLLGKMNAHRNYFHDSEEAEFTSFHAPPQASATFLLESPAKTQTDSENEEFTTLMKDVSEIRQDKIKRRLPSTQSLLFEAPPQAVTQHSQGVVREGVSLRSARGTSVRSKTPVQSKDDLREKAISRPRGEDRRVDERRSESVRDLHLRKEKTEHGEGNLAEEKGKYLKEQLEKFKEATKAANLLEEKRNAELLEIRKERKRFAQEHSDTLQKLNEDFAQEKKKLQQERRLLQLERERLKKNNNAHTELVETIENLRRTIAEANEEFAGKESRMKNMISRLQRQNEATNRELQEVRDELKVSNLLARKVDSSDIAMPANKTAAKKAPASAKRTLSERPVRTDKADERRGDERRWERGERGDKSFVGERSTAEERKMEQKRVERSGQKQEKLMKTEAYTEKAEDAIEESNLSYEDASKIQALQDLDFESGITEAIHILRTTYNNGVEYKTIDSNDKKTIIYDNGLKTIQFNNGLQKYIFPNNSSLAFFHNGDIKLMNVDNEIHYYYASTGAKQITITMEEERATTNYYLFSNGQREMHSSSGQRIVLFPNGTYKILYNQAI